MTLIFKIARIESIEFSDTPNKPLEDKIDTIIARLELSDYNVEAPLTEGIFSTRFVKILLKQHIGVPATPVVTTGTDVAIGTLIASCNDKLGANIHSSISGKVTKITEKYIEICA